MNWLKRLVGWSNDETPSSEKLPVAPSSEQREQAAFAAFQPHNEIERLLMDAALHSDARITFQLALLETDLCAATPDAPEATELRIAEEGEHMKLLNVRSPDGAPVTAIFTAPERIVEVFGIGVGFVAIKGEDLLSMVVNQGAWLNPGFPYSVYWSPEELATILGRPVRRTVNKDTQILLGVPADPPTALIAALRAKLNSNTHIVEAWLALASWPEDGSSSWYLDVRTCLAPATVQDLLAEIFKRADYAGRPLDMILNEPDAGEGIGIRLVPAQTH